MILYPGTMLQDRYEILEKIGSGGMSEVYKAKCHKLNRLVAIKVLKSEFTSDATFVSKFKMEAQAAAGLSHPNIVNIYDYMNSIFGKRSKEDHAIISDIINRSNWFLSEKVDVIRFFFPNYDTKENSSFLDDDFVIIRNLYFNKIKLKNDSRRPS